MNIQTMRVVDQYLGGAICLLLEITVRAGRLFPRRSKGVPVRSILVTKYLGMGSILLSTPSLRELRRSYPDAKIIFLTFAGNVPFAARIPLIDEVLGFRTSSIFLLAVDVVSVIWRLRRDRVDIVLDFEFFARFSTIISYLTGAGRRIGYYLPKMWRGDLLTDQVHFNPYRHVTEVFAAQLAQIGLTVTDFSLVPPEIHPDERESLRKLLKAEGVEDDARIVAVNVNASDLSSERKWPRQYFADLIVKLAVDPAKRICLVGAPEEAAYVESLHRLLPDETRKRILNLSGRLSFHQFLALIAECTLFISNDSGPLHIAASLQIPTVSFYGPESPKLYGPVGEQNIIYYADIYCSPCLNVYNAKRAMCNGNNICMKGIEPSRVIGELLAKGVI